jgi:uncharacterized membrane protein YozB (DUF420 family)
MSSASGSNVPILYTANLILQVAMLLLLIVGRSLAKNKKFRSHGLMMTAATVLHVVSILLVMAPSFVRYFGVLLGRPNFGIVVTWIHVITGTLAAALAIFVVARWRLQKSTAVCIKRKQLMKPLLLLWATALLLGIGFYVFYYVSL